MISLAQVFRPADEDAEAADEVRIARASANARETRERDDGNASARVDRAREARARSRARGGRQRHGGFPKRGGGEKVTRD
jgi:hypothetical protein